MPYRKQKRSEDAQTSKNDSKNEILDLDGRLFGGYHLKGKSQKGG